MPIKGPGLNRYYKKVDVDTNSAGWYDTNISALFPDLFDGQAKTSTIKGGVDYQTYLSDISIPEPDNFGDSELVGLKTYVFPTDVTVADNAYLPKFKVWKSNIHIGDNNEGTLTVDDRNLTVISAMSSAGMPWMYEDFSAGAPNLTTVAGQKRITSGQPFLTLENAFKYSKGWLDSNWGGYWPIEDIDRIYGSDLGGQRVVYITQEYQVGYPHSNVYSLIKRESANGVKGGWANPFITGFTLGFISKVWVPAKNTETFIWDIAFTHLPDSAIQYNIVVDNVIEVDQQADATYTVFDEINVSGDKELYDESGVPDLRARASFSTERTLSGQALKVNCKWAKERVPGATNGYTITDVCGNGATDRQEVQMVMQLPHPTHIDTGGTANVRTGEGFKPNNKNPSWQNGKAGFTGQIWQTDMYFENMDYVFRAKSSADVHQTSDDNTFAAVKDCAILRGAAIMLSRTKPLAQESFYDFFKRTTSLEYDKDTLPHGLADRDMYGTATGIIFARYPIEFGDDYEARRNASNPTQVKTLGKNPLLAMPVDCYVTQDSGDTDSDTTTSSFYTTNLAGATGTGDCFHEARGPTVWYNAQTELGAETMGTVLSENQWYRIKLIMNVSLGGIGIQISLAETGEEVSKPGMMTYGVNWPGGWSFSDVDNAPRYISIWGFNYPGKANYSTDPDDFSRGSAANFDTEVKFYIDNIAMYGMNHYHNNASINDNNIGGGAIDMTSTATFTSERGTSLAETVEEGYIGALPPIAQNTTFLSFGFDTLPEFDQNESGLSGPVNLFFNAFTADTDVSEIFSTADYPHIRAGFTSTSTKEEIGRQNLYSFLEYSTSSPSIHRGLSTNGVNDRGFLLEGTNYVDKFSKKGIATLDFNSQAVNYGSNYVGGQVAPAKRENFFASARITNIDEAKDGIIAVDDETIFRNNIDDTEYVIYKYMPNIEQKFNTDFTTDPTYKWGNIAKLSIPVQGNIATFNKDLRFSNKGEQLIAAGEEREVNILLRSDNTLCVDKHRPYLWVSPYKYWIVMEVFNSSDTVGVPGASRGYKSVAVVNRGGSAPTASDLGATSNEYKYTDASNYLKRWDLRPGMETAIETQTDYGFGAMDAEDNLNGGFVSETLVEEDADTFDKWLVFDLSPIIESDKIEAGDVLSTIIAPTNSASESSITIGTSESTDKIVDYTYGSSNAMRPFSLAIYKDEVPVIENFSVFPNENNPFYPEFNWECPDEDTWYGFLIIDTEPPTHQYHKSSLHVPMWRPLPSTENTFMNWPPSTTDSEPDIIDYFNNKKYQYGFGRGAYIAKTYETPSGTTAKGTHTAGTIADYTTFLNPEGLSGWCHNFGGSDYLRIFGPGHAGSKDKDGSTRSGYASFIIHIRPDSWPEDSADMGILYTGSGIGGIDCWLDSDGKVNARFHYAANWDDYVQLTSHSVAPTNGNPTNIIITFDKDLTHGNCKLFLNGKLEDQSGKVLAAGSSTRWKTGAGIARFEKDNIGFQWALGAGGSGTEYFNGKMEELVYYPHVIYPVIPGDGKFMWTKPVKDIDSNGKPVSYFARLFVKDYHNIRGITKKEVAMSNTLTVHKPGVAL